VSNTKRVPQRYRVLRLAMDRAGHGFTRLDAATEVGCYELASRIGELEAEGVVFHRARFVAPNRYGDITQGVRYTFLSCPKHLATLAYNPEG
jgi:hypothetical protein